ncbi:hypothetical protein [Streptomyces chartreusis]|uniref:hypothetical protein n=1 Tax=Streptomyces chartreusis TaxID=1969 RepID=UPI002F916FC3|nr:hypothetical protein OG938_47245 [Streptomyces chartreusis]WTA33634.1 hypothetical protein OIA45_47775 [Streptomyces chartreusis]
MTHQSALGHLDTNTLREIARVICGDDHLYYRKGYEIEHFLKRAGWKHVTEYDNEYRRDWTLTQLTERQDDPAELEKILLRLADPLEYLDEPEQLPTVIAAVNTFLIHEGYRLENPGGRPRIVSCDPALAYPGQHAPTELKAVMSDIIDDPDMARLLQRRLDEARTCYANGAHVAAIIMLGSLLEGVLLTTVLKRNPSLMGSKTAANASLQFLIDTCRDAGWIDADVDRYAHVLRDYRNFVHPHKEIREAHTPDSDTLNVAWQVVNAALNDLAALQQRRET